MIGKKLKRDARKLQLSNFKLNTLLEITNAINNNASEQHLFAIFENALLFELHIGRLALFTNNRGWKLSYSKGVEEKDLLEIDVHADLLPFQSISVLSPAPPPLEGFDVVIPVVHKKKQLAFLLLADFDGERVEMSPIIKHLHFIQTFTNIVMVALENKHLDEERINQIELQKELDLARDMQNLLLPTDLKNSRFFKVESFYLPQGLVGGDYYDVIELSSNETAFCIADVSGKGISAALLMSNFQANLRAILSTSTDLKKIASLLNTKVISSARYEKFITLFLCIFNSATGKSRYLNAGHPTPILQSKTRLHELSDGCTILGSFEELPKISCGEFNVESGDRLVCYTDGLSELQNEGKDLGLEWIKDWIKGNPSDAIGKLKKKISQMQVNSEAADDITVLTVEFL